ncbi:solute carrier family 22 member 15 [Elysia marginata]|uniref:Solute carrier family 22 member 15 n=1 Tax=Elysia marginata TaxID=1093978 RepID=A0AAV4IQW6_9GAST|nr:solute carrier family 22 member 15 [Elysia marginata]
MPRGIASNGEVSYSVTNLDSALTMLMAVYVYGEEAVKDTKQIALGNMTALELVGPRWRHVVGIFVTSMWSVGILYVGMLAFFVTNWQLLQLLASLPAVLFVFFLCFVPESARWLAGKGRYSEAEKILMHIARRNNEKRTVKIELGDDSSGERIKSQSLVTFLRCPPLLARLTIVLFNWFTCSLIYYGLSLNVGHLSGNIQLNFVLSGIFELIGFFLTIFLLSRVGRKKIYCYSLLVGSLGCLLSVVPVTIDGAWSTYGVRALAMTGKFGIASAFSIIWLFTPEMFPTSLRVGVTGACSCFARCAGIAASYLANLTLDSTVGSILPQIIFGTLGLMAGLLALTLPETNQAKLPDSMEDAVEMKK